MLCEHCHTREALTRDGAPVTCYLFGEIEGRFCSECLVELQRPYERELRNSIAERAPSLTDADLAAAASRRTVGRPPRLDGRGWPPRLVGRVGEPLLNPSGSVGANQEASAPEPVWVGPVWVDLT